MGSQKPLETGDSQASGKSKEGCEVCTDLEVRKRGFNLALLANSDPLQTLFPRPYLPLYKIRGLVGSVI